jgi:hypothetical protein
LPAQAQFSVRGQRDVRRLSQEVLGLEAQMIDAKLAAIGEGGQVRQVDVAVPPKRPLFPRAVWTLPGGALLGLLVGMTAVLGRGMWSSRVRSVADAERAARLPAARLRPGKPLWLGNAPTGVVLVVGVGERTEAGLRVAADALAARARASGHAATVVALPDAAADAASGRSESTQRVEAAWADRTGSVGDLVVVTAPNLDSPHVAGVLDRGCSVALVATEGATRRSELASAADVLARLAVPGLGVALAPEKVGRTRTA